MGFRHSSSLIIILAFSSVCFAETPAVPTTPSSNESLDFFEKSVRPLLISKCGECHGAVKQWAGLRVDSRAALLKGGDTGPAIIPGKLEESLLIQSVRRTGDYEMPPKEPLTSEQIGILERWVSQGAPWPEADSTPEREQTKRQREHWAFQPISSPTPPQVTDTTWVRTPVDAFILAKLNEKSLAPSPAVDRRSLIRRVTYDLTGLPPSPQEVAAFVADTNPNAYPELVERLLASPHYGEHWARHWLDLARYADTKGYVYGREERRLINSATYRDWVVQSFNEDLPYNQFLLLQIAADQAAPENLQAQAAMGFLTVGRRFLGNSHDIIDDRIDVLGRTTMGLTIACARCHDHKYDPIPTADYYSLYGIFQNSSEQHVLLSPPLENDTPEKTAARKELDELLTKLKTEKQRIRDAASERFRDQVKDYLVAQTELEKYPDQNFSQILTATDMFPIEVQRWEAFLRRALKSNDSIFLHWHRFAAIAPAEFSEKAGEVLRELNQPDSNTNSVQPHPMVSEKFQTPPTSMRDVAERYGDLFFSIHQEWKKQIEEAKQAGGAPPTEFVDAHREQLRQILYGPNAPCVVPDLGVVDIEFFFPTGGELLELWKLQNAVDAFLINNANAPECAVVLTDRQHIDEARIFRRGNPATKEDEVTRHFPIVVTGPDAEPFKVGSGRFELAQGIIDPANPLTSRVWVNRIWQHHFGTGIVPTPSDFGIRAPRPEHLELLDWLAQKLIVDGWSTKAIHRVILLSSAYQQGTSGPRDAAKRELAQQIDPENHLLWKKAAHRLTFEEFRDSLLSASSDLDRRVKGRGTDMFAGAGANRRRTLYGYVDRQFLPNVFRVFDFANPDLHIPTRSETTVSQQALFALNHPFLAEASRSLIQKVEQIPETEASTRVTALYQSIYQRDPTPEQLQSAIAFLSQPENDKQFEVPKEALAWSYGYGPVTETMTKTERFQALPHFGGSAWQGGERWPDAQLGWCQLSAEGGHPGNDHDHAVIRRWTSPITGTVSVDSKAKHETAAGNGIRCWIVSSRHGVLQQFTLHNTSQDHALESVSVQPGDTLDFIVDINGQLNNDQYRWRVTLAESASVSGSPSDALASKWDSRSNFIGTGPKYLTKWEQFAQVLLISNEFLFID
ncbi:PSD1 and planctomycete cytochrome C domain-containing protein [Planctomicrobium sp. SH527]|uniref:PSD1 and planctomycete cytochrome C domain-containing protein n=1 Tax=Planctomicrobium sp. SH527 TaxID=3448123 RepID=UPI003F5AFCF5